MTRQKDLISVNVFIIKDNFHLNICHYHFNTLKTQAQQRSNFAVRPFHMVSSSSSMIYSWNWSPMNASTLISLVWDRPNWRRRPKLVMVLRVIFIGWLWTPLTLTIVVCPFTMSVMIFARHLRLPWKQSENVVRNVYEIDLTLEYVLCKKKISPGISVY